MLPHMHALLSERSDQRLLVLEGGRPQLNTKCVSSGRRTLEVQIRHIVGGLQDLDRRPRKSTPARRA